MSDILWTSIWPYSMAASDIRFAVCCGNNTVLIVNPRTGAHCNLNDGNIKDIRACALSYSGKHLVATSLYDCAVVWSLVDDSPAKRIDTNQSSGLCVVFVRRDTEIAVVSRLEIRVCSIATGSVRLNLQGHANFVCMCTRAPHTENMLASASYDCTVRLWDLETGVCTRVLVHPALVLHCKFSPCGSTLLSGTDDLHLRVWDMRTHTLVRTCYSLYASRGISFLPDGQNFVTWGLEGTVVWDTSTYNPVHEQLCDVVAQTVSPLDAVIFTLSKDNKLKATQIPPRVLSPKLKILWFILTGNRRGRPRLPDELWAYMWFELGLFITEIHQ